MTREGAASEPMGVTRGPPGAAGWLASEEEESRLATIPPLYQIEASSLYDAGAAHGSLAKLRITGWLASKEMSALLNYSLLSATGRPAFMALVERNSRAFPDLVDELRGIAHGAQVPLDHIWVANLITELEAIQGAQAGQREAHGREGHCSDIFALEELAGKSTIFHGHNEDWPGPIRNYVYLAAYRPLAGVSESIVPRCAGLVYPGSLIGWATAWNGHGLYQTVNTLFPKTVSAGGLASAFVQRRALCGGGSTLNGKLGLAPVNLDVVIASLGMGDWASGASVNLVGLKEQRAVNVEVHRKDLSVYKLGLDRWRVLTETAGRANYSHFNKYKHLGVGSMLDPPRPSSLHRQARVDSLPAPRNAADIRSRLSDTVDRQYPIFRNMTIASFVLVADEWELSMWCCGQAPNTIGALFSWNLRRFFDW